MSIILTEEVIREYNLNPTWEVYDNSTLNTIDSCIRKAYWKLLFPLPGAKTPGIQDRVSYKAHFGSAIHAAMDKYYSPILLRTHSTERRKIAAFRAFDATYRKLISESDIALIEPPYDHPSGVRLLDDYFAYYLSEDSFFQPIETELCAVVAFTDIDPPCYWIVRADGLVLRRVETDLNVREFKTTSSSLQSKIDELRISRQPQGYVWGLRQFPGGEKITGILADVIAVRKTERDPTKLFMRDVIHISPFQAEQWRRETVTKIQRWRSVRTFAQSVNASPLTQHFAFDRNTNECLRYGKCSYYDLCVYGLNNVDIQRFLPNDWNPLYAEKMEGE